MRLDDERESGNVEDRRGMDTGGMDMGRRGIGIPLGTGGLGLGGILLLLVLSYALGVDPLSLLSTDPSVDSGAPTSSSPGRSPGGVLERDPGAVFASKILADTEDTWTPVFKRLGARYEPPVLVLSSGQTESACGLGSAATGPFYCPNDQKVYLDLSFFQELARRFRAPGDFAQAYVIAHEVGHHVQNSLGALSSGSGLSRRTANAQSVRQELQADCLAGVWGHSAAGRGLLETGDAEEGLMAAAAVGDDRLQREGQGRVVPDSFTHGSSADRVASLRRGLDSGDISACGLGR
jgi:predicted metalloprotease